MNKNKLKIITPEKLIFEGEAQLVIARAIDGDIGIMYHHEPSIIPLGIGELKIKNGDETKLFSHSSGFLKVLNNEVTVIVDSCESSESIDVQRATDAMERAKAALERGNENNLETQKAEIKLKRALNRLEVAKKQK